MNIGYSEAHFEPRNRWGGSKHHAVRPDSEFANGRRARSVCGLIVHPSPSPFEADSAGACQRCARSVS